MSTVNLFAYDESNPHYYLEAALFASEDYHLLANAANKFWNLIDL